jgi:hypothetical protein
MYEIAQTHTHTHIHTNELVWKMDQFSFPLGEVVMASLIEIVIFSEYQVIDQVQKTNNQITVKHSIPAYCVYGTL